MSKVLIYGHIFFFFGFVHNPSSSSCLYFSLSNIPFAFMDSEEVRSAKEEETEQLNLTLIISFDIVVDIISIYFFLFVFCSLKRR